MQKNILFFLATILLYSCQSLQNETYTITQVTASDSIIIKEDSLIINEGGITDINPINDSLCLVNIDQSKSYILNYKKGIFVKEILIPDFSFEEILKKTNWVEEHPDLELLSVNKDKNNWIENCVYDSYTNTILIYYCPVFKYHIKDSVYKPKQLLQTLLLSYDINGNYQNFYFISDKVNNCDSCFPGFNHFFTKIDNSYLALNKLFCDKENRLGRPILLYYKQCGNNLCLDSVSSRYFYPEKFDGAFGIKIKQINQQTLISDSRIIYEFHSKKKLFSVNDVLLPNCNIEDFTFKGDSLIILIFQKNFPQKGEFSNYVLNEETKELKNYPISFYNKFIYKNKLVFIGKNEKDSNYKIYNYPL